MSKSTLQINLEYVAARLLLAVFGVLPQYVSLRVGSIMAGGAYYFSGRLRRTGERNLRLAFPELSPAERRRLLRGCFQNLGRLLGVFSQFANANPPTLKHIVDYEGLEHLDAAQRNGRGVILFTGHVGAWELTSFALSLFDHPLSFLVRPIDNPKIETLIDRARTRLGNRTIDKTSAAREMLQILEGGGTLGILVDLNTLDREGIFVDFFWRAGVHDVHAGQARSANWRRCAAGFCARGQTTPAFTSVVEDYVRRYPDQWLWIHRRWKTRPMGEVEIYD